MKDSEWWGSHAISPECWLYDCCPTHLTSSDIFSRRTSQYQLLCHHKWTSKVCVFLQSRSHAQWKASTAPLFLWHSLDPEGLDVLCVCCLCTSASLKETVRCQNSLRVSRKRALLPPPSMEGDSRRTKSVAGLPRQPVGLCRPGYTAGFNPLPYKLVLSLKYALAQ